MSQSEAEILVIGAGAAGIAAARRLRERGVEAVVVEARSRPGGRAWTIVTGSGLPLDLGCGWLHSAERNPWTAIAREQNRTVDQSPPPWSRERAYVGPQAGRMIGFGEALFRFRDQTDAFADGRPDVAVSDLLDPGNSWRPLLDAVSTYYSGAPLERISARDLACYDDSGVNWRVVEGLGAVIAEHARSLRIEFDCEALRIEHGMAGGVIVQTTRGDLRAQGVIVTLPSDILASRAELFSPLLLDKTAAAANLPLGLADKIYLSLPETAPFEPDARAFGRTDTLDTAAYHFRPLSKPIVEAYFGGDLAERLEEGGQAAFLDFARAELSGLFGAEFAARLKPLASSAWRKDLWAKGAYSYARPAGADSRKVLAAPVNERVFFAGEACSPTDYSTAHGAYFTGVRAADEVLAMLGKNPRAEGAGRAPA